MHLTNGTLLDRVWMARFKKISLTEVRTIMVVPSDIHDRLRPIAISSQSAKLICFV